MKKKLWLLAGITGVLLGNPVTDSKAEVSIHIGLGGGEPRSVLPFCSTHGQVLLSCLIWVFQWQWEVLMI